MVIFISRRILINEHITLGNFYFSFNNIDFILDSNNKNLDQKNTIINFIYPFNFFQIDYLK